MMNNKRLQWDGYTARTFKNKVLCIFILYILCILVGIKKRYCVIYTEHLVILKWKKHGYDGLGM